MSFETYQEARLVEGCVEVYRDIEGKFHPYCGGFEIPAGNLCKPEDYCMRMDKFLSKGYKVVLGDYYFNSKGDLVEVKQGHALDIINEPSRSDPTRYIVFSRQMEKRKKEVKLSRNKESTAIKTLEDLGYEFKGGELWEPPVVEVKGDLTVYTKCEFKNAWEAVKFIEDGGSFFVKKTEGLNPFWIEVKHLHGAVSDWEFAYIKVVIPEKKKERELALYDMLSSVDNHTASARFWAKRFYDAGYRKSESLMVDKKEG